MKKKTKLKKKEVRYLLDTAWMYDLFNLDAITDGVKHKLTSKWVRDKYEPIYKSMQ